jgi:hypothetical protein
MDSFTVAVSKASNMKVATWYHHSLYNT